MPQTLAIDLSDANSDRLSTLAQQTGRSEQDLISEAIESYLATQEWQIEAITLALRASERGESSLPHERAAEWLRSWGTDGELPRPAWSSSGLPTHSMT